MIHLWLLSVTLVYSPVLKPVLHLLKVACTIVGLGKRYVSLPTWLFLMVIFGILTLMNLHIHFSIGLSLSSKTLLEF